jgi:hypothetical protein
MPTRAIAINRAPVLTLWAAVVARRLGFTEKEAVTLGRALAGLNAQSKGRKLGLFKPHEEKAKKAREKDKDEMFSVEILGRPVPALNTGDGVRAVQAGKPINPGGVERYLEDKFGDDLKAVRAAMQKLARSYKPVELARTAYPLYERFRPEIPAGMRGWGARGELDLERIEDLAKK